MGMGPKENTAQTPDVETPCTHTAHIYKDTQLGKGGGNQDHKVAHLACCDWLVCNSGELSFFAIFFNKRTKDKETKCLQEKMRLPLGWPKNNSTIYLYKHHPQNKLQKMVLKDVREPHPKIKEEKKKNILTKKEKN